MEKGKGSKTSESSTKSRDKGSDRSDDIPPMDNSDQHPSNLKLKTYWVLVALRFFLTIIPQNGYIQPDEFFQSVEVVTGKQPFSKLLINVIY